MPNTRYSQSVFARSAYTQCGVLTTCSISSISFRWIATKLALHVLIPAGARQILRKRKISMSMKYDNRAALGMKVDEALPLIEGLQRRDPAALADLYDLYGRLTYSLILRIVRDTGIAEDLTQETFLRVWISVGRFDAERGSFRPWLLMVARNRAIDYLRAADGRLNRDLSSMEGVEDSKLLADLERNVANSGETGTLRGALAKLSINQRLVIDLAYFEGYSQTEMAAKLGNPLGTVKTWVRSALNLLREELRAQDAVEPSQARLLSQQPKNDRSHVLLEKPNLQASCD